MLLVHGTLNLHFDRLFYAVIPPSLYPSERGILFANPMPKAELLVRHKDIVEYLAPSNLPLL